MPSSEVAASVGQQVGTKRSPWSTGALRVDEPLRAEGPSKLFGRDAQEERIGGDLTCVGGDGGPLTVQERPHGHGMGDVGSRRAERPLLGPATAFFEILTNAGKAVSGA